MNETNNTENFKPLLSKHNAILEKYKTLLAPTNTNNMTNGIVMNKTCPVLNRNIFQQEVILNKDFNSHDKAKQVDSILNNLNFKRNVQEFKKVEIQQKGLNVDSLKEKYLNYINNPGFKYNNPSPVLNPNDEIQRIKAKYFSQSIQGTLQQDTPSIKNKYKQFLDDEVIKYQEMTIEKMKPIVASQQKENIDITNRLANISIQDKEDNTLLISKMSVFDIQNDNSYQKSNSKFNISQKNDDIKNNISYDYSKSSNENDQDEDQVNYEEVNSIVQRMERLKEMNNTIEQQAPIKDNNIKAKEITKNVINSIAKNYYTDFNTVDNEKTLIKQQPYKGLQSRTQKPKVKLVSFDEFLEFDN